MKEAWNFSGCVSVLKEEIELLKRISATQNKVRQAAMKREWADFDEKITEVNRIGEEFDLLENERIRLFSALANGGGGVSGSRAETDSPAAEKKPFYALIAGLPWEEGRQLAGLYHELKMETLKLRALNKAFFSYLNEARTVAAAYLEAVCPARSGKLYTRKGSRIPQDLRSMVFNDRF